MVISLQVNTHYRGVVLNITKAIWPHPPKTDLPVTHPHNRGSRKTRIVIVLCERSAANRLVIKVSSMAELMAPHPPDVRYIVGHVLCERKAGNL